MNERKGEEIQKEGGEKKEKKNYFRLLSRSKRWQSTRLLLSLPREDWR
jgi:hypothetical protein